MSYRIVSDCGADFTPELIQKLNVEIVPLTMNLGDDLYVDDDSLNVDNFITKMHEYKGQPKSSCPSPQEFIERCSKEDTNFIVTLSSKLSGSYESANLAKNMLEEKGVNCYVFDSKNASVGQMLIVKKLRELIDQGLVKTEIINKLEEYIAQLKVFFVLENLENLIKNGRMSKVTGLIAGVLNIRPILKLDENGEIVLYSKVRGEKNSIIKLAEVIGENYKDTHDRVLAIAYCRNIERANKLKTIVQEKYNFKEIIITPTHGLMSMYANEGGVILAF